MKRKLGITCDCIGGEDAVVTLHRIKKAGFDSTFTGIIECDELMRIKKECDVLGLDLEFVHAPFKGINNMWLEGDEYREIYDGMIKTIDSAAACNVPAVIIHLSSGWNSPEICDIGLARYDALVDYADKKGVIIAFENLRKVGDIAYFADRYEHRDCVRFCYDNGHEHGYTKTVSFMDIFTDRTICTHIHDNLGRGWEKTGDPDLHLLPFDGNFDFGKMMRKLDEYGYGGSLMLEVFNGIADYSKLSADEFIKTCYDRIKKISEM